MEHAPLRPVPSRPTGPVDPAAAKRHVARWLPGLPDDQAEALALAALVGRPPEEEGASGKAHARGARDGAVLSAARKELRRSLCALPGSGWCERAERLISDRLDGDLEDRDAARLAVHLRNCPRCGEHERRLVQATDALVTAFMEEHPAPVQDVQRAEPAALAIVTPGAVESDEAPPEGAAPQEAAPEEVPPEEAATEEARPLQPAVARPARVQGAPAPRDLRRLASVVWNVLFAIAVLLAIASIALTVAGILGAEL